jgi:hypothetical protein
MHDNDMILKQFNTIILSMTNIDQDRRKASNIDESDIYKASDIDAFIDKERRHDELDRLREIKEQKNIWLYTVLFCAVLNIILIALAIWGAIEP